MSTVQRVVLGMSGSLGNLSALHAAVAEARRSHVPLLAVHAWTPVGGDVAYRRAPCPPLFAAWQKHAEDLLTHAFEAAFGGLPADLDVALAPVRGAAVPVLVQAADRAGDLLVLGAGRRSRLGRVVHGHVTRACATRAHCPILVVPQPAPAATLSARFATWDIGELIADPHLRHI